MLIRFAPPMIQVLIAAAGAGIAPGVAFGLSTNPIDRSLPLSIHTRAACFQGPSTSTTITVDDDALGALCHGTTSDSGPMATAVGTDSAAASVSAGTLRASATGRSLVDGTLGLHAGAGSTVYLYDTLTVQGSWSGTKIVTLGLHVHGSFSSNAATPNWQGSSVNSLLLTYDSAGLVSGGSGLFITQGNNGTPFITSLDVNVVRLTTNASHTVFDPADVQFDYAYDFPATPNSTFTFMARLQVLAGGSGLDASGGPAEYVVDFGRTAQFSLDVPSGVTVTSSSGQFLAGPVPEPAARWQMLAGLMVVALGTTRSGRRPIRRRSG